MLQLYLQVGSQDPHTDPDRLTDQGQLGVHAQHIVPGQRDPPGPVVRIATPYPTTPDQEWTDGVEETVQLATVLLISVYVTKMEYQYVNIV